MQQESDQRSIGSVRAWEAAVAIFFLVFGAIVSWDSHRIGSSWAEDGPQAGYFPFYIGVFIIVSSLVTLYRALRSGSREPFVTWGQLRMVLVVIIPTIIYVALIANPLFSLGIYEASVLFIAAFMRVLGKYSWLKVAAVSIATMVAFFLMFEIWFQVPLPKGPIEAALGYA
ncbi:MAG TPA: tripartite tricarboxylate transporter TctB family protein [Usitatibacter sp.]|nr:tripartite tricarboxylate transporter TctB family protein [Usitatibacter sp.]